MPTGEFFVNKFKKEMDPRSKDRCKEEQLIEDRCKDRCKEEQLWSRIENPLSF